MPDEPDEAQAGKPVAQTAKQVAEHALTVAQACRDAVTELSARVIDTQARLGKAMPTTPALITQLAEAREEMGGFQTSLLRQMDRLKATVKEVAERDPSPGTVAMEEDALADRITALTDTAMRPIIEGANAKMHDLVERVSALENLTGVRLDKMIADLAGAIGTVDDRTSRQREDLRVTINELTQRVLQLENRPARIGSPSPDIDALVQRTTRLEDRVTSLTEMDSLDAVVADAVQHYLANRPAPDVAMPASSAVGGVHRKVLELMRNVTEIGKDKTADAGAGGRFKFRGIDAAMGAVGHAMRAVGVTLETSVVSSEHDQNTVQGTNSRGEPKTTLWTTTRLVARYTFVDPEDGSRHSFEGAGEGRDASDKATSKAMSMALKYGLFQALMIPVEGLDESDGDNPQVVQDQTPNQPPPVGRPAGPPPQAPQGDRPPPSRDDMARGALAALRKLDAMSAEQRAKELPRILDKINREKLSNAVVEDSTLAAHVVAITRTLAAPAPPAAPPPSNFDPDDPWGSIPPEPPA